MLKRLLKCVKGYWFYTIATPICVLAEVLMSVLIPYKMADLIDKGVEAGNMEVIKQTGMVLLSYALISMMFGILSGVFSSIASCGFATNIRHDMYYKIQTFSFSNVDKFSTAGLVTRMTSDVTRLQFAFNMSMRMASRAPANMIFALIMSFRINRKLPLVFIAILPFLGFALGMIMKHAMPLFKKVFESYDDVNRVVQENVRGIRVVKSFVREDHEKEKFETVTGRLRDLSVKAERIVAINAPVMNISMYICSLCVCWIGAKLIVSGEMTTGQLMSIMNYILQILMSLMMLSMVFLNITQAKAAGDRVVEVLDEEADIKNCDDPVCELKDGSIKFEDVSFAYADSKDCLKDINFEIKSGETIGIIGGTGTGKTSLVQLIPRLYDVKTGAVYVGGDNVKDIDLKTLRSGVAMVLQKNLLFSGTIRSNMQWGKEDATDEEIWEALRLAQAENFVRTLPNGLDSPIEQGGSNVSGGQKQRLCIARALLTSPKILILDDSTSAVDTATEASIRKGFKEFMPEVTKLIIAQRISSVKDADRIIVIDDGIVSGIGTHEELLASNRIYQEVYESQTKGGDFDEPQAD
ncbi:MAG: ABC transporter ATP-binding protein [Firmicutes bacterium]|nr:ABC transporter ATP-binding protein [Bacillota bacterium]